MKSDSELERDVKEELRWKPDLDATDIAVSAHNGVVTLTGFVRSYTDKGTSKNRRFPPPRKSDSRFSYSERGRLAWDSLASSI